MKILEPVYSFIQQGCRFLKVNFHVLPENISRRSFSDVDDLSSVFVMVNVAPGRGGGQLKGGNVGQHPYSRLFSMCSQNCKGNYLEGNQARVTIPASSCVNRET